MKEKENVFAVGVKRTLNSLPEVITAQDGFVAKPWSVVPHDSVCM